MQQFWIFALSISSVSARERGVTYESESSESFSDMLMVYRVELIVSSILHRIYSAVKNASTGRSANAQQLTA